MDKRKRRNFTTRGQRGRATEAHNTTGRRQNATRKQTTPNSTTERRRKKKEGKRPNKQGRGSQAGQSSSAEQSASAEQAAEQDEQTATQVVKTTEESEQERTNAARGRDHEPHRTGQTSKDNAERGGETTKPQKYTTTTPNGQHHPAHNVQERTGRHHNNRRTKAAATDAPTMAHGARATHEQKTSQVRTCSKIIFPS